MKIFSKIIRLPFRLIPDNVVLPILFGGNKKFYWIKGSGVNSMWIGTYEKEKQNALRIVVKPGMICYDVGAHVGFYSLLFSRLTGSNGKVYAFEPLLRNIKFLKKHIELNNINNVTILNVGVSEKSGCGYISGNDNFTYKIGERGIKIKLISIDEEIQSGSLLPPDVIKIDVEGHELFVLKGAINTLRTYKPAVLVAMDNYKTKNEVFNLLKSIGYIIYDLKFKKVENSDKINELIAKL